jgi:hypothetical protein
MAAMDVVMDEASFGKFFGARESAVAVTRTDIMSKAFDDRILEVKRIVNTTDIQSVNAVAWYNSFRLGNELDSKAISANTLTPRAMLAQLLVFLYQSTLAVPIAERPQFSVLRRDYLRKVFEHIDEGFLLDIERSNFPRLDISQLGLTDLCFALDISFLQSVGGKTSQYSIATVDTEITELRRQLFYHQSQVWYFEACLKCAEAMRDIPEGSYNLTYNELEDALNVLREVNRAREEGRRQPVTINYTVTFQR